VQRRIRTLGGEEATDRLRRHISAPRQLRLAEAELFAPRVQRPDDAIDLVDPLPGTLVRFPILRVLEANIEVALCARALRHGATIP